MDIKINIATPSHLNIIQRIGEETYQIHFSEIWSPVGIKQYLEDEFNTEKLYAELHSETTEYYLIIENGQTIGYLKLLIDGDSDYIEIDKIYLLTEAVAKGIGSRVISFVNQMANRRGISYIVVKVLEVNLKAIKFYRKMGFYEMQKLPFDTDIVQLSLLVMKREAKTRKELKSLNSN